MRKEYNTSKTSLKENVFYCVFCSYLEREPWRPQTYRDAPQPTQTKNIGTAVYHAQYNSPIGLYSDDKVLEAFKNQTGNLIDDIKGYDLIAHLSNGSCSS